jgi:hypothetical protein
MTYRLGRKCVKTDSRTLRLAKYTADLPTPPASSDWTKGITQWGMMLNDTLGDCTIAGLGHALQVWTVNASTELTVPDSVIEGAYEKWCGYKPNDPNSDQGGDELTVLNGFKKNGLGGQKLLAFADPFVSNITEIQQTINLFGGAYIGFNVPASVVNTDTDPTIPWDVTGDQTIEGGHAVWVPKYDENFLYPISWGQVYKMTYAFWEMFVDEAHALLSPDWIAASGLATSGFNLSQLQSDLSAIQ